MEASLHSDNCKCEHCARRTRLLLDPIRFYTAEETRVASERSASQIVFNHETLSLVWTKLGESVASNWRGSGHKKRVAILERVLPARRPELELWCKSSMLKETAQRALLHPYLNVEDLAGDDRLLSLIKMRATFKPGRFAAFDLHHARMSPVGHDRRPDGEFKDHTMLLSTDGSKPYGSLEGGSKPDNQSKFQVHVGLAILWVQAGLYASLVELAAAVFGKKPDLSHASLRARKDAKIPNRALDVSIRVDSSGSLQPAIAQTPFCEPSEPDFDLLDQLVTSKRDSAIHHVVNLRENPPYFEDCMRKWASHLTWDLKKQNFDISRWLMIHDAYQTVWLWPATQTSMKEMRGQSMTSRADLMRFQALQDALKDLTEYGCRHFEEGIPIAKTFKKYIIEAERPMVACGDDRISVNNYVVKPGVGDHVRRLLGLFFSLCLEDSHVVGLHNLNGEIDKLLRQGRRYQDLMDPWLDERSADLLAVTQVQAQLQLWRSRISVPGDVKTESRKLKGRKGATQQSSDGLSQYPQLIGPSSGGRSKTGLLS